MTYSGSCHCGRIAFEADLVLEQAIECNCSHCRRKGYLLAFAPRDSLRLVTPEEDLATYTFNTHRIRHHFCPTCGCAPSGEGADPSGKPMAAVNMRCLEGVDLAKLTIVPFEGASL